MSFHVGQKVVCVNNTRPPLLGTPPNLKRGEIYTVSAIGLRHPLDPQELPCILVEELPDSYFGLWAHRFRPVVDTRKSVSFTIGANPESEHWDNRKKQKERVK